MGVTGLWRLIEPAGKPVPVETLENKVLAVDISIWLHQMVKGYQDAKGAPLPNAHLMGLFQRLCKLLYFRIKPVFVFDGAFPELKKETIAKRQDSKSKYHSESERLKRELALLLSKKTAVSSLLGKQISPKKGGASDANPDDLFKLPALPEKEVETESESEEEDSSGSIVDLHSVDVESENFKKLPIKEKYNLLIDLKETRKMNSWGKLHTLPKKSDNFSDFQMQRLLKRRKVQEVLEETEKEMGDIGMSLNDLESLLNEEGIDTKIESLPTRRIASDNTTRILMINNVKQALEDARKRKEAQEKTITMVQEHNEITAESSKNADQKNSNTTAQGNPEQIELDENTKAQKKRSKKDELQDDLDRALKLSLEYSHVSDISASSILSKSDNSWTSALTETDSEDGDGFAEPDLSSAKAYITQYTDFTPKAINNLVSMKRKGKSKPKLLNADQIIEELNKEKSIIIDNVNLSSSDDDFEQNGNIKEIDSDNPSTINLNSTQEDLNESNVDATQASVVCVEAEADIISLNSSKEDEVKDDPKPGPSCKVKNEADISESSDDDFEEVPEVENEFKKPVVQITLKVGEDPGDDDIFADVFDEIEEKSKKIKQVDFGSITLPDDDEEDSQIIEIQEILLSSAATQVNKESTIITEDFVAKPSTSGKVTLTNNDEEDEDLQRAIQMSLECADQDDSDKLLVKDDAEPILKSIPAIPAKSTPDSDAFAIKSKSQLVEPDVESVSPADQSNSSVIKVNNEPTSLQPKKISADQSKNVSKPAITSRIEPAKPPKKSISEEQLKTMAEEMQNEEQDLIHEKARLDRIGRNITEQMTKEAQELLQIFGIPYLVAPMEAEAQCAFLESVNLTDGTITDDSDIWLFGGRTVYKNFFNQKKHVLQFLAERIERSFNLTREQLVLLALLVGSDYTTGVTGVGPVTALEILASFPFNKKQFLNETSQQARYTQVVAGLQEFKKWVKAGKRTDDTTLKKKLKNVDLTDDFPSVRVVQAYLEPNVEKSEEKFTWGELDITILRDYAKAKFGWSQHKLDEIIKPVIKRLADRKSQRSVQDYFKKKVEFQSIKEQMSKRVIAAVQRMGPEGLIVEQAQTQKETAKPSRKRRVNKKASTAVEDSSEGPYKAKQMKNELDVLKNQGVTVASQVQDGKSGIEISIPKTDRFQEIIPQREKDKQSLLQNKMKAIEVFRKTKLNKTKKRGKKRVNLPKQKAELSESSDTD